MWHQQGQGAGAWSTVLVHGVQCWERGARCWGTASVLQLPSASRAWGEGPAARLEGFTVGPAAVPAVHPCSRKCTGSQEGF